MRPGMTTQPVASMSSCARDVGNADHPTRRGCAAASRTLRASTACSACVAASASASRRAPRFEAPLEQGRNGLAVHVPPSTTRVYFRIGGLAPGRCHVDTRASTATGARGEVRFDRISRALYATDASVYRSSRRASSSRAARGRGARRAAGGGTSDDHHRARRRHVAGRAGDWRRAGARHVEVPQSHPRGERDERWARVEPGVVLDDLNAHLKPHGLRFAPDLSSSSRATVGGMMANNSSGARSIVYGKTIDHVLEQHVVLADGRRSRTSPGVRCDASTRHGAATRSRLAPIAPFRGLPLTHADEIARRFPKVLRRVGGYNLDAFVDAARPVDLTRIMVGSEGTLGIVVEAQDSAGAAADRAGRAGGRVRARARCACRDALGAHPWSLGGRGDGRVHPRAHARVAGARRGAPRGLLR